MMQAGDAALERRTLWLMALIQFIDIWDFMIVMPLGPDFGRALGIDVGHLGWIAGSYSVSAAISGLFAAPLLDRLDRKRALMICLGGLSLTTGLAAFATGFYSLMIVRALAGAFGGPVIALSYAVIADVFPESRRGEAMGKVMGSFAIAAILGVPLGLEIARWAGWWAPFIAVAASGLLAMVAVQLLLPSMRLHLMQQLTHGATRLSECMNTLTARIAMLMMAATTMAAFMIIPNISAHVQLNMHYPREQLGLLYACGGAVSLIAMRLAGPAADRVGFARTAAAATALLLVAVYAGFVAAMPQVPVLLIFVLFMGTMAVRNITTSAIITKIPGPRHRAGFMSVMSAIQHLMSGIGAFTAGLMLGEKTGKLVGIDRVALVAMVLFVALPVLMLMIERRLKQRPHMDAPVAPVTEEGFV